MWRILHFIFGWDYILLEFGIGYETRRIEFLPDNSPFVNCHGQILFLNRDATFKNRHYKYWPLTFTLDEIAPNQPAKG